MKMADIILSSMTIVILGFMAYFTYMYLRMKIEKAGRKPVSFGDEARYNKMLDQIMFTSGDAASCVKCISGPVSQ